jgi:hypothetical protein
MMPHSLGPSFLYLSITSRILISVSPLSPTPDNPRNEKTKIRLSELMIDGPLAVDASIAILVWRVSLTPCATRLL